jgi:hypothetical protein
VSGPGSERAQAVPRRSELAQFPHGGSGHAAAGYVLRDPVAELCGAILEVNQIEPAEHRAVFVDEHVEDAGAALLLREERLVAVGEVVEVVIATVGDRPGEVGPVRPFEGQHRLGMVGAEALQLGHRPTLLSRPLRPGAGQGPRPSLSGEGRLALDTMAGMSLKAQSARALRAVAWRIERPQTSLRRKLPQRPLDVASLSTDSEPESRSASWFFEQYPRFYQTSATGLTAARLNLRYEAIFGENRDIFAGASVIDIASHDGRWSLAALATGARSVIGIEPRPELVAAATENLAEYGYGADSARFITGDAHEVLKTQDFQADVVLCLGFLYHTLRYNELLDGIRRTNARHLIIDTFSPFMMQPTPNVNLTTEYADEEGRAVADAYTHGQKVLVGRPNLAAIQTMLNAYDYEIERLSDWAGLIRDNTGAEGCDDYANRKRVTVRCVDMRAEA